jgi:hypothetical protein
MAIKGKAKSRGRRVVAIPPRPPVYVRKPAFWQRKVFWIGVAVVVVLGILVAVKLSLNASHDKDLKAQTLAEVTAFKGQVESKLPPPPDSQAVPPTGYTLYPTLAANLDKLATGKLKDAGKNGASLVTSAKASGDAIEAINVIKLVSEEASYGEVKSVRGAGATRLALNESKKLIAQSFRIYQSVGELIKTAAGITDPAQLKAIAEQAKLLAAQASTLFHDGYQKIINVQGQVGTIQTNPFPPGSLGGG